MQDARRNCGKPSPRGRLTQLHEHVPSPHGGFWLAAGLGLLPGFLGPLQGDSRRLSLPLVWPASTAVDKPAAEPRPVYRSAVEGPKQPFAVGPSMRRGLAGAGLLGSCSRRMRMRVLSGRLIS